VNGVITRYVYDAEDILLEYDGADTLLARYTHGPGIDEPLVMARDLNGDQVFQADESFLYLRDGQGSVIQLTDNAGMVVRSYAYDSRGGISAESGTVQNHYTFTSREFDAESGNYYYRARYYSGVIGRFISEDPIGFAAGDSNLYRYVFNNSINFFDPSGLECFTCINISGSGGIGYVDGVKQCTYRCTRKSDDINRDVDVPSDASESLGDVCFGGNMQMNHSPFPPFDQRRWADSFDEFDVDTDSIVDKYWNFGPGLTNAIDEAFKD